MKFSAFTGAETRRTVYVNPDSVIRVEHGAAHYNEQMHPNHRTFIAQTNGGVFVTEPIDQVLTTLEDA